MEYLIVKNESKAKRYGLLANIFVPLAVMFTFGLFYISFAVMLLVILPIVSIFLIIQFLIFRHRIKKIIATNLK